MSVLWCGGEDIDFQRGQLPTIDTTGGHFRSGYARCALVCPLNGTMLKSNTFPSGAVSNAWASLRGAVYNGSTFGTNQKMWGFGQSSPLGSQKALVIYEATSGKVGLATWDGSSLVSLATEAGNSMVGATQQKYDLHVQNFGASGGIVDVYVDGTQVISFTGQASLSGFTSFDCVVAGAYNPTGGNSFTFSEVIVADEDVRAFSLVTGVPNAAGFQDQWTGAYTDIDEIAIDDTDVVYTPSTGQVEEFGLSDLPVGTFAIKATKVISRSEITSGAAPTSLKLGYYTNSTKSVDSGHTLSNAWDEYERIDQQNPVTSSPWTPTEINALQIALESA